MTSSTKRSICITCKNNTAFFTCPHCQQDFCEDHINEHEQMSFKQIDEIIHDEKQIEHTLLSYINDPIQHPLIQQIDKWEKQSINQIKQTADDARARILNAIGDYLCQMKRSFENLKLKLKQIQHNDASSELYLKPLKDKLDHLKSILITPETIRIDICNNKTFISKLLISIVQPNDLFQYSAGNVRIEEDGQLIIHGQWSDHSCVRAKNEYSSGRHLFRFKLEQLDSDKWAFVGIVSKNAPMNPVSIKTPTAYGMAGQNGICRNGFYNNTDENQYQSDMEMNDILQLFIDCDEEFISLKNERTHSLYKLDVDVKRCPFPWQLILGLCCSAGDRIRILSCTYEESE